VVISASAFGKVKTAFQVAMVMTLIAVHGRPLAVNLLVYATVIVTVLSGADYFFGLRRSLASGREREPQGT
jgi:CDP-diacylglycerol--glycerol-3-phosphate 3-phosphatidyltransferase